MGCRVRVNCIYSSMLRLPLCSSEKYHPYQRRPTQSKTVVGSITAKVDNVLQSGYRSDRVDFSRLTAAGFARPPDYSQRGSILSAHILGPYVRGDFARRCPALDRPGGLGSPDVLEPDISSKKQHNKSIINHKIFEKKT